MLQNKFRGVMQSPVTPLKDDFSLDLPTFEKVLDFHVRTGATAISWPHHKGESLNLTIDERKLFAEAAVKTVAPGCEPVSGFVRLSSSKACVMAPLARAAAPACTGEPPVPRMLLRPCALFLRA